MRTYFFKNRAWFSWPYREAVWKVPTEEKVLFLTFDDGPDPEVTEYVLELLARYDASATFFCVGDRVEKHPEIVRRCIQYGHAIGNHTFHHLNGWKTANPLYLEDVAKCDRILATLNIATGIFRPPYGNIRFSQLRALRAQGRQVVMWSHLSGDFDRDLDVTRSLSVLKTAGPGAVVVFHDSAKACQNLKALLPPVLDHFSTLGYSFQSLNNT